MKTEPTDLETAYAEQLTHETAEAVRWGELITIGADKITDWSFQAPKSDDPETWRGVTRWAYCEATYIWHNVRVTELKRSEAPYYCPACGFKKPAPGWRARRCVDCWWVETGYDAAVSKARKIARGVLHKPETWEHPYWWPYALKPGVAS